MQPKVPAPLAPVAEDADVTGTMPRMAAPIVSPTAKAGIANVQEVEPAKNSVQGQNLETANRASTPVVATATVPATGPEKAGVVICAMNEESIETTIKSVEEGRIIVVVLASDREGVPNDNLGNQIVTVQLSDAEATAGRARNAGYRALKKLVPDLVYVQFVDAGEAIDPDWLGAASRHMDRRPELSAVEGKKEARFVGQEAKQTKQLRSSILPAGEVQTCKATAMFRAQAFEAAGGFRGDIAVNETEDLCIRLRRRGGHIWRIEPLMSISDGAQKGPSEWWGRALKNGYSYAVGAALHGGPPERFRVTEQARAIMWGFVFPTFVLFAALFSYLSASFLNVRSEPALVASVVLVVGAGIYFIKIALAAFKDGPFAMSSWGGSIASTLAHFPEFLGIARYWAAGRKVKSGSTKAIV